MEALPWAAVSILLLAVLGLWNYTSSIAARLSQFEVKVAESYTPAADLDKAVSGLTAAMKDLQQELRELRREIHQGQTHASQRFPGGNRA